MAVTPESKRLNIVFNEFGGSQKSFGDVLGVTQGSVSRMLKGEYPITLEVVKAVCYKLGYAVDWFLKGEGNRKVKGDKKGKIVTDIAEFRTELDIVNTRIDLLSARMKGYEQENGVKR